MPREIVKTVYGFSELIDGENKGTIKSHAVDKARQWLQESQFDDEWWWATYETWTSALDQIGFTNAKIYFEGFGCQGHGASFSFSSIDCSKLISFWTSDILATESITYDGINEDFRGWIVHKVGVTKPIVRKFRHLLKVTQHLEVEVFEDHHRKRSLPSSLFTICPSISSGRNYPLLQRLVDELDHKTEYLRGCICNAIYKDLEVEYQYLNSDEALIETSDENDYLFDSSGIRFLP